MVSTDAFRDRPVLHGARVRLEPLTLAVLDEYWEFLQEPESMRLTGTHSVFTREQAESWLGSRAYHPDRADWAPVRARDGAFIGEAVINGLDPANGTAAFRIALAGPRWFGRGYGTEITRLVVAHAMDTVGLHRLELEVYDHNPRTVRTYERCGFVHEGRRRDALLWDGHRHDALIMSVVRSDPRT